ncbi:hypothetical protein L7F22_012902 [Adiantum nelumboides]|nr:hypothetical protein [Adiantum nelumboides]MCO5559306.1 hypothetical protein [Adiantum nelumboides]
MQASVYPAPSSSTTKTGARGFASSLCRGPVLSSPSKLSLFRPSKSSCLSSSRANFSACRVVPAIICKVPNITQDSFPDEVLKYEGPVLVGFCAEWCGPCKLIGPVIDSVAKDFNGSLKAVKIDVDTSPDLVKEYDVYGLPTLIVFKDGKEVPNSRKEGAINAKKLKVLLDEVLSSTATP